MTEPLTLAPPRPAAASLPPEPKIRLSVGRERLRKRLARRAAGWAGLLLLGYWLAAFTATHMPMRPPGPGGIPNLDKVVHLAIYTGLALLLSVWFGVRKRVGGAMFVAAAVLVALTAYATFDELTQIPVGRTADFRDWFADLAGINFGLFGFFALRSWVRK